MQEVIILLIFLAAVAYVVRMLWRQAKAKDAGCAKGCGGCSTIDPDLIEKQIKAKQQKH
jgi:hypothetical protein